MTYLDAAREAAQLRTHESIDVLALVGGVFPGAELTARRTPREFAAYWAGLTRLADARKRSETIAAVQLEQLREQRRQTPVATMAAGKRRLDELARKRSR